MQKISRRQIARGELDTAINLYVSQADPVSAHVLTSAAIEVMRGLAKSQNMESPLTKAEAYVRPEKMGLWRDVLKRHYNFFKHADRDPECEIEFNPEATAFLIMAGIDDYSLLFNQLTMPMIIFRAYFVKTYPDSVGTEYNAQLGPVLSLFDVPGQTSRQVAANQIANALAAGFADQDGLPAGIEI